MFLTERAPLPKLAQCFLKVECRQTTGDPIENSGGSVEQL